MALTDEIRKNIQDAFDSLRRTDYDPLRNAGKLELFYVDSFNQLSKVMAEDDSLIVGRQGTGKSALLYRAYREAELSWSNSTEKEAPRILGVYIDLSKLQPIAPENMTAFDAERLFLSRLAKSVREEVERLHPELADRRSFWVNVWNKRQDQPLRQALGRLSSVLADGGQRYAADVSSVEYVEDSESTGKLDAKIKYPKPGIELGYEQKIGQKKKVKREYGEIRRLMITDVLAALDDIRVVAGISRYLVLLDEFSSLNRDVQVAFSAFLKSFSGEGSRLYKKVAVLRDEYSLHESVRLQRDFYRVELDLEELVEQCGGSVTEAMKTLAERAANIIQKRFDIWRIGTSPDDLFESPEEAWPDLARSYMGVPRMLGIVLSDAWRNATGSKTGRIRKKDLDAAIISAYRANREEVKRQEISENILSDLETRARLERRQSKLTKMASHFLVHARNEKKLEHLVSRCLVHLLRRGRGVRRSDDWIGRTVYAFDYGLCLENALGYATDAESIRNPHQIFDDVLSRFDQDFKLMTIPLWICPRCSVLYYENDLEVGVDGNFRCREDECALKPLGRQADGGAQASLTGGASALAVSVGARVERQGATKQVEAGRGDGETAVDESTARWTPPAMSDVLRTAAPKKVLAGPVGAKRTKRRRAPAKRLTVQKTAPEKIATKKNKPKKAQAKSLTAQKTASKKVAAKKSKPGRAPAKSLTAQKTASKKVAAKRAVRQKLPAK